MERDTVPNPTKAIAYQFQFVDGCGHVKFKITYTDY